MEWRALHVHSPVSLGRLPSLPSFSSIVGASGRRSRPRPLHDKSSRANSTFSSTLLTSVSSRSDCPVGSDDNTYGGEVFGGGRSGRGRRLLNVVLVSPQIAGNTGSIARTCAASAVDLHLVQPLGYKIDDAKLKRAGLDYWPYVVVKIHSSWEEFREYFCKLGGEKRLLAFTKRGASIHSEFSYKAGDWLVFGSETAGLPSEALLDCNTEGLGGGTIRIPMVETYVRCLNLSVSVGIALYEASRQLNYEQMQCSPNAVGDRSDQQFVSEDIYA